MKSISLVAATATAQVLNNDSCKAVKWEKEKISFKVDTDGQLFSDTNLLRRYEERNNELR